MFGHYLPNKNESATVAQNPKFPQLNTALQYLSKHWVPNCEESTFLWCYDYCQNLAAATLLFTIPDAFSIYDWRLVFGSDHSMTATFAQ